ncbi:MAG TPA: acyl-CoA dehydrogenase [Myxococcales bacterium]|nr:acyl-CoA dehydrogenase [Myxococcales bacterium]HIK83935.1 acyl-CoA dehydrogenase [Myxococcales bacterium]
MILLNPHDLGHESDDERTRELMRETVEFFEAKGKRRLLEDYYDRGWYADFLEFAKDNRLLATMCTPEGEGADDTGDVRWDTWRVCQFAEILGFYGLQYWYTWQVSVLGLGPIWMSANEAVRKRATQALEDGGIFAFGLSEKTHGADIYSTDMVLTKDGDGWKANGSKYYIGNGNEAAIVSTFGRLDGGNEYVFFASDPKHENYHLVKNVVASQNYVSEFELRDYPVSEKDILHRGRDAWNAALNTVNIGKYNLGWASIGICTHALYEAITHANNRVLYGNPVTDMSHVRNMFVDAYCRLVSMKLFALRAADYMRSASREDRRYLLFNPMVKMKVTTQGEDVINSMWDAIAAKGFEKDTYFSQAAVDIRALPKLEGTVHVNIALIVKFMANYFFNPGEFPEVERQDQPHNDDFLFDQGGAGGLGQIQFHDYRKTFDEFARIPNVALFAEQADAFRELLASDPPGPDQMKDVDFLLAGGNLFAMVVYAQLILENAKVYEVDDDLVGQIFDFMIRDTAQHALALSLQASSTEKQMAQCREMMRKPIADPARYGRVWESVRELDGAYEMKP